MAPLTKQAPRNSKRLIPDDTIVASAIAVNGTTVSGGSLGNLVAGSLNSYVITDSTIDSTTIGFSAAAAAVFTQLTVGSPSTPGDATFWGSPSSYAKWIAASGLWKINSNGNSAGGLLVDNIMMQNNILSTTTGPLILHPSTNVVISPNTAIKFDSSDSTGGTSIYGSTAGGLQLTSASCINLTPTVAVTIPTGIPLWFDGTCSSPISPIYRSGIYNDPQSGQMLMGGQGGIAFSTYPGTSISLSTPNTPLVFGPLGNNSSPTIQGDSTNSVINITSLTAIELNSPVSVLPPNGRIAWNPHFTTNYITGGNGLNHQSGVVIAGGDDDVQVKSNANIVLGPAQNVMVPGSEHLIFPQVSASLGADASLTNFIIQTTNPQASIVFQAGSGDVSVPLGQTLQFGSSNPTSNQSISSGGQSVLNITAPQINLNGNVVITGEKTEVETKQLAAEDPIVQLGLDLPAGNVQDRGWMAQYAERQDPLLAYTFMGWQPTISAFSLLSQTHDDGTGHYVPGMYGDLQAGNLTVTNSITSRTGTLNLSGSSIAIGDGVPLYIGSSGAGFISDSHSAIGDVLTVLENKLQVGTSLIRGGTTADAPLTIQNRTGGLQITSGRLQLGSTSSSPYFTTRSPSTSSEGTTTYLHNSTNFQLPNDVRLQWGDTNGSVSSAIFANSSQGNLTITAYQTLLLNTPSITGPVAWQASPIGLAYGGTGRAGFSIDAAIPFVDLRNNVLSESTDFRYLTNSKTLLLGSTQIQSNALILNNATSTFLIPQGSLRLGSSSSYSVSTDSTLLDVYGDINVRTTLYIGAGVNNGDKSRYLSGSSTTIVGQSDVVLGGSSLVLDSNTLVASSVTTALQVRSPLVLDSDKHLLWTGSSAAEINGLGLSNQLSLNAVGGISVPSGPDRALTWQGGYTGGETVPVGFFRTANTLNYLGSSLTIGSTSNLAFAVAGNGTNFNTIQSNGSGGLNLTSSQNVRLSAPQVIIDADLRVLGTTIETISKTTVLNDNIFQIGQGQTLQIVALTSYSGSQNQLLVQTQTATQLQVGQYVQITNVDSIPDTEGKYQVISIVSPTQFTISSSLQLTQNGTQGKVLAPLISDPAVDVGFQLGYFNGNAMNAFLIWQHSTQSYVLYKNGTLSNGVVINGTVAPLTVGSLQTVFISGFTLLGPLIANSQLVSGSSFSITGGSIANVSLDQWSTSTTTLITNLNSDRVRGLTTTDFVLRDGSQALLHDWYAGSYHISSGTLGALNCTNSVYTNTGVSKIGGTTFSYLDGPVLASSADGTLYTDYGYYGYDPLLHTLVASIDVSSSQNDIYLRDQQISGTKIGPGLAHCDITGNSSTVTNGVYRTDYTLPNSILVSTNGINNPQPISLLPSTILGTNATGQTQALNGAQLSEIIGPYLTYEKIVANLDSTMAPLLNLTKSLSKICPDTNSSSTTPSQISYVVLPNGDREGQLHHIKGYQLTFGITSIAVQLRYIAPADAATSQVCWLYLTNNGQSIELIWDDDTVGWYNSSAGLDVFKDQ